MSTALPTASAYRAVWRWHFYAGIMCAPLLLVLSITGALYLFEREIEAMLYAKWQPRAPTAQTLPLSAQEAAVLRAFPDGKIRRLVLPISPGESSQWVVVRANPEAARLLVFVDPNTAQILGFVDEERQLMTIVRRLHGELLAGDLGSYLVELTACWTLVMLVTGIYLWWPKRWRIKGVVLPRITAKAKHFWRDIHAIPALLFAPLVLFLLLSGLPWSVFWGENFARLGNHLSLIAPSPNFGGAPIAPLKLPNAPQAEAAKVPWSTHHAPAPKPLALVLPAGPRVSIDTIAALAIERGIGSHGPTVRLNYPRSPDDYFVVSYIPDRAQGQRTLHINPYTAQVVRDLGWHNYGAMAKAVEWGTMAHMGRQFGLANQLLGLATCLALVATLITGIIQWIKRRPRALANHSGIRAFLGATPTQPKDRLPRGLLVLLGAICILFPLVGLSLLGVLLIDRLIARSTKLLAKRALHG